MGLRIIRGAELLHEIRRKIVNNVLSLETLGGKIYLKPMHIVVVRKGNNVRKYVYINRYWWKIAYNGKKGHVSKIKWKYLGKRNSHIKDYELRFKIVGEDIIIDEKSFVKLREILGDILRKYDIIKER